MHQHDAARTRGIADLPGFAESLRLLIEREEYAVTDIALMFDVSRERMRQLVFVHSIDVPDYPRGLNAVRVWDDTAHCFRPVSRTVLKAQDAAAKRRGRHLARDAAVAARRVDILEANRTLTAALGHPPTAVEWASAVVGAPVAQNAAGPILISRWAEDGVTVQMMRRLAGTRTCRADAARNDNSDTPWRAKPRPPTRH